MRRLGVVLAFAASDPQAQARFAAFQRRFQDLGWIQDHNIRFHTHWIAGDKNRLPAVASEMIECTPSALVRQFGVIQEGRISGSS
jgi:hypothetical protein